MQANHPSRTAAGLEQETLPGSPTLWVLGTSVSIEHGGYATHLERAAAAQGWQFRNLSVGDQTSLMGWMRLMQHAPLLRRGDVVIWEYSLLDQLLPQGPFAVEEVRTARRLAWRELARRGLRLVVAITPPLQQVREPHAVEHEYRKDAESIGAAVVDLREVAALLGMDLTAQYRDDRHPATHTALLPAFATAILDGCGQVRQALRTAWRQLPEWTWLDATALAAGRPLVEFSNRLLLAQALELAPDEGVALPEGAELVAAGVVSTHVSGGLWCGHAGCPPASTRLPRDLQYRFLLRTSGLGCRRPPPERIAAAPEWSFACGQWRDYGQEPCADAAPIAVFGIVARRAVRPSWYSRWLRRPS